MTTEKNGEAGTEKAPVQTMIPLHKPLKLPDGREFTELDIDVDKLNMGDLHNLEMEYGALFPGSMPTNGIFFTDSKYHALMIARINGIIYDNLRGMSARDSWTLSNKLGRFLTETA